MNEPGVDGMVGDLGALLALESVGVDIWRSVAPDTNFGGEVFGGQYLGLSVGAAMLSAPGRAPHAMTSFFLRAARADRPVDYRVERTRDGREFAHRRVTALQDGKETFRAEISFHEWQEDEPMHAAPAPTVPPAEQLPTLHQCTRALSDTLDPATARRVLNRGTFATHFTDPDEGLTKRGTRPETVAWLRPNPPPPIGDFNAYFATIAYLSDACANAASRITHNDSLYDGGLQSVSLNHAIWFHGRPCAIERVLFAVESPFAGGGLGYNRGTIFGADGRILASVVQEALIRRRVRNAT